MNVSPRQSGPVALVGSGEYLDVMSDVDRWLLDQVGGASRARVVVIPTASGLEDPSSSARWMRMGVEHFTRLRAQVAAVPILTRQAASDPQWLEVLGHADFFYFSGGNPQHLIATMMETPAWDAIRHRHQEGAVLAGCSAGAMAICGLTTARMRVLREGDRPEWMPALGLLPRVIVMPHFDRMSSFIGRDAFNRIVRAVPSGLTLLGVDEDTALVRQDAAPDAQGRTTWRVMGRQTVSIYEQHTHLETSVHAAGETVQIVVG